MTTEFKFGDNTYTIEEESRFIVNNKEFKTREAAEEYIRNKDKNDVLLKYKVDPELKKELHIPYALYRRYFPQLSLMDQGFEIYKADNDEEYSEIMGCIKAINNILPNSKAINNIQGRNRIRLKEFCKYPEYIFYNKFRKTYINIGDILEDGNNLADDYKIFLEEWNKFKDIVKENNISET